MNVHTEINTNTAAAIVANMPAIEQHEALETIANLSADLNREPLTRALYVAMATVERQTAPILQNIKIQEHKGNLQVTGTDLDLEITVTVAGSIDPGFSATLPALKAHDLLAKSRKSDFVSLVIDQEGETIAIYTEKSKFNLQTLPVNEFPLMDCEPFTHSFKLNGDVFWNAIDGVQGAISTEETRYYLNGIYCHEYQDKLRFVATDGHRMYLQDLPAPRGCQTMPGVIIHHKTIAIIQKLTKAAKFRPDSVKISISETKFQIEFDNVRILSKVIDGTFPDYRRVMPDNPHTIRVISKDLAAAIKDVSLISSDKDRAIKLSMVGDALGLSMSTPINENAESSIPMHMTGDEIEIGFNSKYLTELLPIAGNGEVQFKFNDSRSPTRITGEREGWQGVLMPMCV